MTFLYCTKFLYTYILSYIYHRSKKFHWNFFTFYHLFIFISFLISDNIIIYHIEFTNTPQEHLLQLLFLNIFHSKNILLNIIFIHFKVCSISLHFIYIYFHSFVNWIFNYQLTLLLYEFVLFKYWFFKIIQLNFF